MSSKKMSDAEWKKRNKLLAEEDDEFYGTIESIEDEYIEKFASNEKPNLIQKIGNKMKGRASKDSITYLIGDEGVDLIDEVYNPNNKVFMENEEINTAINLFDGLTSDNRDAPEKGLNMDDQRKVVGAYTQAVVDSIFNIDSRDFKDKDLYFEEQDIDMLKDAYHQLNTNKGWSLGKNSPLFHRLKRTLERVGDWQKNMFYTHNQPKSKQSDSVPSKKTTPTSKGEGVTVVNKSTPIGNFAQGLATASEVAEKQKRGEITERDAGSTILQQNISQQAQDFLTPEDQYKLIREDESTMTIDLSEKLLYHLSNQQLGEVYTERFKGKLRTPSRYDFAVPALIDLATKGFFQKDKHDKSTKRSANTLKWEKLDESDKRTFNTLAIKYGWKPTQIEKYPPILEASPIAMKKVQNAVMRVMGKSNLTKEEKTRLDEMAKSKLIVGKEVTPLWDEEKGGWKYIYQSNGRRLAYKVEDNKVYWLEGDEEINYKFDNNRDADIQNMQIKMGGEWKDLISMDNFDFLMSDFDNDGIKNIDDAFPFDGNLNYYVDIDNKLSEIIEHSKLWHKKQTKDTRRKTGDLFKNIKDVLTEAKIYGLEGKNKYGQPKYRTHAGSPNYYIKKAVEDKVALDRIEDKEWQTRYGKQKGQPSDVTVIMTASDYKEVMTMANTMWNKFKKPRRRDGKMYKDTWHNYYKHPKGKSGDSGYRGVKMKLVDPRTKQVFNVDISTERVRELSNVAPLEKIGKRGTPETMKVNLKTLFAIANRADNGDKKSQKIWNDLRTSGNFVQEVESYINSPVNLASVTNLKKLMFWRQRKLASKGKGRRRAKSGKQGWFGTKRRFR